MTKLDLQKELLAKIKPGVKASELKKNKNINGEKANPNIFLNSPSRQQNITPASSPPVSPIIEPVDKKSQPKYEPESILPPPIVQEESQQIKQLQEQVNYWATTAQTHLTNLQRATAQLDQAEERIKELEWVLKQKPAPGTISQAAEQALMEANQKIRDQAEIIKDLQTQVKPTAEPQPQETKTFLCSDCKQTQPQAELSRQFANFSFCRTCSLKARQQAQQEKISPESSDFICHICQQTKQEIPAKMKLDQTLQAYLICSTCRPNLKEFNEADLITDELWAKYPYSSASEILEKEFGIKKEEPW